VRHRRAAAHGKARVEGDHTRLNALTAAALEAFVMQHVTTPGTNAKLAAELGVQAPTLAPITAASSSLPANGGARIAPTPRWRRVELALGLELHLREDASAPVLELAERLFALARGLA
jgi:hypothetical protein